MYSTHDVEDWYQVTETILAEYSHSGCVEKADLKSADRDEGVILRPPPTYVELFDFEGYQGYPRRKDSLSCEVAFPTSIYENIQSRYSFPTTNEW